VFFGLSAVFIKWLFEYESLVNGFFWSRMGNVLVALLMLLVPTIYSAVRLDLFNKEKGTHGNHVHRDHSGHRSVGFRSRNKAALIFINKILAGLAFLFILIAIKYSNVSVVNALTATQYIFLLIFAIFFGRLMPEYFSEKIHKHEFLHKTIATVLIVVGFFLIFI